MGIYLQIFAAAVLVDLLPFVAPPAWIVLTYYLVRHQLPVAPVLLSGVCGVTVGRLILATVVGWVGTRVLSEEENENLRFLGRRLSGSPRATFAFTLVYALTPLSTAALFTAAGLAHVPRRQVIPPFFVGKLAGYAVILSGADAARRAASAAGGEPAALQAAAAAAGALLVLATLAIDWKTLLEDHRLRWSPRFWKGNSRCTSRTPSTR